MDLLLGLGLRKPELHVQRRDPCGWPSSSPPPNTDASTGDCSTEGCPTGYVCKLSYGTAQCVPNPSWGSDASAGDDAGDGSTTSEGGDAAAPPTPCNANTDCTGQGAKCIDGACTPQGNLCSDTTQCVVSGEACVEGVCQPHCSASDPCPAGYGCDFIRGVCSLNPSACVGSGASTCQGGTTCVEGRCVAPCAAADAGGGACPVNQVCVNGGCIPNEAASFSCQNNGENGQLANTCSTNSICLHHDCYAACELDGGTCPSGQSCKNVTTGTGTYAVCAAPSTLGSDCDPATGKVCSGSAECIDGTCK